MIVEAVDLCCAFDSIKMDAVCVDSSKRRLPIWMIGMATAADPVGKNSESNREEHEDGKALKGGKCGRKKKQQNNFIGQDGDSHDGVIRNAGKRKSSLSRVVPRKHRTDDVCSTTGTKRKSKAKASSIIENGEEIEGSLTGEKDEDLTMEDIMSIAKEVIYLHSSMIQCV